MSTAASAHPDAAAGIRAADERFEKLANAGDAAGIAREYYTEDARVLPPNSPVLQGRAAIETFWAGFVDALHPQNVKLETTHVESSGDLAVGVGNYSFIAGGAPQSGRYLVAFRRQADGSWKCAADSFGPGA